jgi:nitric oxide reductase NorQ protein
MIQIERLPASEYAPPESVVYEDVFALHKDFAALAFKRDIILVGPKGIGKSLSIVAYASQVKVPLVLFGCSQDVRRTHQFGHYILRGADTPFILGPLPLAFEIANEVGACILCYEEINALDPNGQKLLNMPTDIHRKVVVPEAKRTFQLKPGAKLWITGTMNLAVYGGVYSLNEDLTSRFRLFPLDYPTPKAEMKILQTVLSDTLKKLPDKTADHVLTLAHETRQKALDYALSTRDVVQVLQDMEALGLPRALWLATGKFEGDDRSTVKEWIKSIFGVAVA